MRKHILLVLFFGITIIGNAQILNVPEITQEYDQWCWVGVSKCVLDYYGYSHSQCEIAEYTRNVSTWNNFGTTPCCENALQGCNYWNYNYGTVGSIQDILVHFGNIGNNGRASSLSISEIQNNINQQRPFIIRWGWKDGGGGHFIVGHGIQNNNIYYMDPWFGEGFKISTYENVKDDEWHKWTHTNVLLGLPFLSSIAVTTQPTKTVYIIGETLDLTGIVVTATYSDSSTEDVTADCTFNPANGAVLNTLGTQTIEISYTEGSITKITTIDVTVNDEVGIAETYLSKIKIYPNPSKGILTIENAELTNESVVIFDIFGKKLSTFNLQQSNQIDISHLSAGTYFLRVGKENVKIVKNTND